MNIPISCLLIGNITISFAWLKLEGHALTWRESHTETLRLEGEPLVTKWKDFKTLIKSKFYLIGYVEN